MTDPFTAWSRILSAGLDMQSTWLRGLETMAASRLVMDARTTKMGAAAISPMTADVAELSRMIPEKVDAFSRSASSVARDALAMHGAWTRQVQRVGMMMMAGRLPTIAETMVLAKQTAEYSLGVMTAGARLGKGALAPVHRTATGNARRLERAKRR